jgi:hypothetical protein
VQAREGVCAADGGAFLGTRQAFTLCRVGALTPSVLSQEHNQTFSFWRCLATLKAKHILPSSPPPPPSHTHTPT